MFSRYRYKKYRPHLSFEEPSLEPGEAKEDKEKDKVFKRAPQRQM